MSLGPALAALAAYRQFIVYRAVASATRPGKTDKLPCDHKAGELCDAHDPQVWTVAATARDAATALGQGYGIGFVLTESDPFFCLDIDNCLLPDGTWSPLAQQLAGRFAGAAVEVSQSGKGLHIWGRYTGPAPAHSCRNGANGAELYTSRRFIALGLPGAVGDAGIDHTATLHAVISEFFPPSAVQSAMPADGWTDGGTDPADDDDLIARMLASRSVAATFGSRASFADLWNNDTAALGRAYPDASGTRAYDASSADAALAQHLAFWTGKDCECIKRLMLRSALVRDKWERVDYLPRTILQACAKQETVMQPCADTARGWQIAPFSDDAPADTSHDQLALDLSRAGWVQDARYVHLWGAWLFWNGTRWVKDEKLAHMSAVRDFLRAKAALLMQWAALKAASMPNPDDAEKFRAAIKRRATELRQAANVAAVAQLARSNADLVAAPDQFNADLDLLGTPSGAIDLRTGHTRAPNRADYMTRSVAVDPAPIGIHAPLWTAFLARVFNGDAQMIAFIQRAAGYALTGHTREQKLLFFYGIGANGKSVFLNTLHWLWAEYAKRAPADTFLDSRGERHPTELAGLMGARLVVSSELPPGKSWNEAVIKDLTGSDVVSARFMRQDFFEYLPQFTLLIAGNHMPTFRGVDEAIRRRVLLVPFTVTIPKGERDPELSEKLKAEGPAILRWCIDGAVAWYRQGLNAPASVEAASVEYLDGEDMLKEFLEECTTRQPGAAVPLAPLYFRFASWCTQRGLHAPWTQHALTRALGERGLEVRRRNDGRWLSDHQLK